MHESRFGALCRDWPGWQVWEDRLTGTMDLVITGRRFSREGKRKGAINISHSRDLFSRLAGDRSLVQHLSS